MGVGSAATTGNNLFGLAEDQASQAGVFGVVLFSEDLLGGLDAAYDEHDWHGVLVGQWGVGRFSRRSTSIAEGPFLVF